MDTLHIRNITKAPPHQHNRWCGPAVISALTGLDTRQSADFFTLISKVKNVRGTSIADMLAVLGRCGIHTPKVTIPKRAARPTLAQWLRSSRDERGDSVVLLIAGCHWRLVQGDRYICGLTDTVIDAAGAPGQRTRVTHAFTLAPYVK